MQAIDLEANLEGSVKAVLFPGTAFAVFGQDGPNLKIVKPNRTLFLEKFFEVLVEELGGGGVI